MEDTIKLVKVTWDDVCSPHESWSSVEDLKSWAIERRNLGMVTIGYLICEETDYIIVGATHDTKEGDFGDISMIPRGMIKSIEVINCKPTES